MRIEAQYGGGVEVNVSHDLTTKVHMVEIAWVWKKDGARSPARDETLPSSGGIFLSVSETEDLIAALRVGVKRATAENLKGVEPPPKSDRSK